MAGVDFVPDPDATEVIIECRIFDLSATPEPPPAAPDEPWDDLL